MNVYTFLINIADYMAKTGHAKMGNLLLFRARMLESNVSNEIVLS